MSSTNMASWRKSQLNKRMASCNFWRPARAMKHSPRNKARPYVGGRFTLKSPNLRRTRAIQELQIKAQCLDGGPVHQHGGGDRDQATIDSNVATTPKAFHSVITEMSRLGEEMNTGLSDLHHLVPIAQEMNTEPEKEVQDSKTAGGSSRYHRSLQHPAEDFVHPVRKRMTMMLLCRYHAETPEMYLMSKCSFWRRWHLISSITSSKASGTKVSAHKRFG